MNTNLNNNPESALKEYRFTWCDGPEEKGTLLFVRAGPSCRVIPLVYQSATRTTDSGAIIEECGRGRSLENLGNLDIRFVALCRLF
jgi:hypothetical protein